MISSGSPGAHAMTIEPAITGVIRSQPEDFEVHEVLGFEPSGHGEHLMLQVEKRLINTHDVLRRIGEATGVSERDIGCCGLKDKHAVAKQWFSVLDPVQGLSSLQDLDDERIRVVTMARHNRKLRRGAHRGNRFRIRVRQLSGNRECVDERLRCADTGGVPNFFGPQRFGTSNLARADDLFKGRLKRLSRSRRGILLSAARSSIFNEVLARRVRNEQWSALRAGDVAVLDGSNSFFRVDAMDETLQHRLEQFDIHPSGPLFGVGENPATGGTAEIEADVFDLLRHRCDGLIKYGLRMERRSLRLRARDLEWTWPEDNELLLSFELPRGGYATSVLGYIGQLQEPPRHNPGNNE